MIKALKKITIQMVGGANIATILMMLLVGYSDRIDPLVHPFWANMGLAFPVFLVINTVFLVFWAIFKVRGCVIPIIGFILCYVPARTYVPINISRDAPEGAITVMSYNVYLFGAAGVPDEERQRMLDYIKVQDADILCLQEAKLGGPFQVVIDSMFAALYPYRHFREKPITDDRLAFYSKFPILSIDRIVYPHSNDFSLAYHLAIEDDTVIVINNHFMTTGLSEEQRHNFKALMKGEIRTADKVETESKKLIDKLSEYTKKRAPQVNAVAHYIDEHKGKSIILCGDFNDNPISYTHCTLAKRLTDCYVASGNGPGISYHRNGFYVRIDNIMCTSDWQPYGCKVDNKIKTSDHYPIICRLKKRDR